MQLKHLASIIFAGLVLLLPVSKISAENFFVAGDNQTEKINSLKDEVDNINKKVSELNEKLEKQRLEASSLKDQLEILDGQIKSLELEIELVNKQIEQTELEIQAIEEQIRKTEEEINQAKEQLAEYIRIIWRVNQTNPLEIIFLHDSLSDVFAELNILTSLQTKVGDRLTRLKTLKARLEHEQSQSELKKRELENLKKNKEGDLSKIESQRTAKKLLLEETRSSEAIFQKFIQELKAEQSEINNEIVRLESELRKKRAGLAGPTAFIWPVPNRGLTAAFMDPTYPFRHLFEHAAIDIRASQGSPIKAAADGEVAIAKDAGRGYNYVLVVHNGGFSSLYGHVSKIFVKPGQEVFQGDVIALVGGLPGTPGAGRLTTGPHLHLEIRKDGSYIDPMTVLP